MKRNKQLKFSQWPNSYLASSSANFNLPPRFYQKKKNKHTNNHAFYFHQLSKHTRQNN
ncbi:hypothetical protein NC651_010804 [Populus alba x Populus x berolinensis]|nr:hypothetical protein NC651_010804 [Populus alba x Populus x berolinensis]